MKVRWSLALVAGAFLVGSPSLSRGAVIFVDSFGDFQSTINALGGDVENVLFDDNGGPLVEVGTTVQGETQTSARVFDITSDEELTAEASGAARIDASDDAFSGATISPNAAGGSFAGLAFNLNAIQGATGSFTLTAFLQDGTSEDFVFTDGGFLGAISDDPSNPLVSVGVVGSVGNEIDDIRQIRVASIGAAVIPEPATLVTWTSLMLLGVVYAARRKR